MSENRFPANQYDDVKDIVATYKSTGSDDEIDIFYDPNGQEIPQHQMDMIQENQDLIRREVQNPLEEGPELPSPEEEPTLEGASRGDVIHANFGGQEPDSTDVGFPPAGRGNPQAPPRQSTRMKNFLSTTPESDIKNLERAEWLQAQVDNIIRGFNDYTANDITLNNVLNSYSKEFTELVSKNPMERLSLSEGGLKLLQRGLIAGNVPSKDELLRLGQLVDAQDIKNVLDIQGLGIDYADPDYENHPRYIGESRNYGPYKNPEQDTVACVKALVDPANWELSPDDRSYLTDVLQADKLDKYKHKPGPSGAKYFWNRKPFNFYIKQTIADAKEDRRSGQSVEEARQAAMSDPQALTDIARSDSIVQWWTTSVGQNYKDAPKSKSRKDQMILDEVHKYAQARLDLDGAL